MRIFNLILGIAGGTILIIGSHLNNEIWRTLVLVAGGFIIGWATQ